MVSSSCGLMVCWWLSCSPCLLAASPGLLVAHSPLGSHVLIVSRSHGLLVFSPLLLVSWLPIPPGFSWSHRLAVSWSAGGSRGLLVFSPLLLVSWLLIPPWVLMVSSSRGLMLCWWLSWSPCLLAASPGLLVAHSPLGSHGLIVSRSHGLLVALMVSLSSRRFSWSLGSPGL